MPSSPRPVILATPADLARARALIYRVFIEEVGFRLGSGDAVGRRAEEGPAGLMLVDDFDPVSCFFGLVDETGTLAAVHRASRRADDGAFQVERFGCQLPTWLAGPSTIDVNRLAIDPAYRGGAPLRDLLNFEMDVFIRMGFAHIVTAAAFPRPGNAWIRMGMRPVPGVPPFKMNAMDAHELTVLYADLSRVRTFPLRVLADGWPAREAA